MVDTSSGVSANSTTSKFSAMRCASTDFGITHVPGSRCLIRVTALPALDQPALRATGSAPATIKHSFAGTSHARPHAQPVP